MADRGGAVLGSIVGSWGRSSLCLLFGSLLLVLSGCIRLTGQATPTPIPPTFAPVILATPLPTASSTPPPPTAKPTLPPPPPTLAVPVDGPLYVMNTGSQGLTMRREPNGEPVAVLPDGTPLTPTGEEQEVAGRTWRRVRDTQGREGWVAGEFLTATAPAQAPATVIPTVATGSPAPAQPIFASATPFTPRGVTPVAPRSIPPLATAAPIPTARPATKPTVAPIPAKPTTAAPAPGKPTSAPAVPIAPPTFMAPPAKPQAPTAAPKPAAAR